MPGFRETRELQDTGEILKSLDLTSTGEDFKPIEILARKKVETPKIVHENVDNTFRGGFERHPKPFSSFTALFQNILTIGQWFAMGTSIVLLMMAMATIAGPAGITLIGSIFSFVSITTPTLTMLIGSALSLVLASILIEGLKPKPREFDFLRRWLGWKL